MRFTTFNRWNKLINLIKKIPGQNDNFCCSLVFCLFLSEFLISALRNKPQDPVASVDKMNCYQKRL